MQKQMRSQKGFTLIELVVVVAILGVLAVVLTPKVLGAVSNARDNSTKSSAKQVQVTMERYFAENGAYPGVTAMCGETAGKCDPANVVKALEGYVSLNAESLRSAAYTLTGSTYSLTLEFKDPAKSYVITANSVVAQ